MKDYKVGEEVDDEFLVLNHSKETTSNGKPFIRMDLRDKEGTVVEKCKRFDCTDPLTGVIRVIGKIDEYKGQKHIKIEKWVQGKSPVEDFLAQAPWPMDSGVTLYNHLLDEVDHIAQVPLRTWTKNFLWHVRRWTFPEKEEGSEQQFNKIYEATGARGIHHGYQSGWLEHTLEVVGIVRLLAGYWADRGLLNAREEDLALVGAIIHDVGKLFQFEVVDGAYDMTALCKAYGWHSNAEQIIGSQILLTFCLQHGFPLDNVENYFILHNIICSHHGKQFSIAPPVYKISRLVNFADHISADMNRMSANLWDKDEVDRDKVKESYMKVKDYGEELA